MGCGQGKLKIQLEQEITQKRDLKAQLQQLKIQSATRQLELTREIKFATKSMDAHVLETKRERRRSQEMFDNERNLLTEENTELSKNLKEKTEVAEVATTDAQKMRLMAMKMEDVAEENRRLQRERQGLEVELEQAKEDLRLARLVFDGQKQVLELEKEDAILEGQRAVQEAKIQRRRKSSHSWGQRRRSSIARGSGSGETANGG